MIAATDIALWAFWLAFCAANTLLAGAFAGMETGAYFLNKVRLALRAESGDRDARRLQRLLDTPDNLLALLLIGTNLHQYLAAFAISAMFVLGGVAGAEWYALAVATPLLFVFKDSLPKNLFQRTPEKLAYRLSGPMRLADILYKVTGLSYLVRLLSGGLLRLLGRRRPTRSGPAPLGHEGLSAVLADAGDSGPLTGSQRAMVDRVIRIGQVRAGNVMQPMKRVVATPDAASRDEFLRRVATHDYSRVPLLDADGRVTGIVDIYDVLTDTKALPPIDHAAGVLTVPVETPVTDALCLLQRSRQSMAIVTNRTGRHVGLLTIKDLVEEVVGELKAW